MHELQVKHHIVQMVQNICQKERNGYPHLVRIEVSSHSHLATHTPQELEATFRLAAHGTSIQHMKEESSKTAFFCDSPNPNFKKANYQAYTHHQIPPNDGGLSLGQAMIAACKLNQI